MAKQKRSFSKPILGMDSDSNIGNLKANSYILGINVNNSNEGGDSYTITNEPSNYLSVQWPENYKVIGFKNNELNNRTYFFITSTETNEFSGNFRRSSVGYIDDSFIETYNSDIEQDCPDCSKSKNLLGTPLEQITQTPSKVYNELLHDRCISLAEIEEKGLNFDINFPIKKIEIKQEKLGTTLYWNDNRNPFRFLQVGRIEEAKENDTFDYLHTEDIACDDPIETACLDVDKLLVYPKHTRLRLEADKEQIGGNLKQGTYEFWGAYCDIYGNEITEYSTPTNPISIWDENNYIQSQTETDDFTNYAIKLKVYNLDKERFKYYKIAVVERNNVDATQSVFLAGIYPTTDDIVVYTHSGSSNDDLYITRGNNSIKKRMDFNTLMSVKPHYVKMKGTMVSDDRLFGFGLEEEPEINLQPVVNLFSSLVKAQTSVVSEDLYKSAIATSKYKAYPRNEVQALALRLLYNDGGYSSNFPFVGRPKSEDDATIISDSNINKASLIASETACNENTRQEKWQIFNTASLLDEESCFDLEANSIALPPEVIEKTCYIDIETVIPANTIVLPFDEVFYDLESYVNDNPDLVIPEITPYLEADYAETCTPAYIGDCEAPVFVSEENEIEEVIDETQALNYKDDGEYLKSVPPAFCTPYKRDATDGALLEDTEFMDSFAPCSGTDRVKVYVRDNGFQNESCAYAAPVAIQADPSQSTVAVFFNYDGAIIVDDLLTDNATFTTTVTGTGFYPTIHNKAQFFRIEKNNRDKIVFEITKKSPCKGEGDLFDSVNNTQIRYVIYDDCGTPTELGGEIVDLNVGTLVTLDVSAYPYKDFIIAVDCKIISYNAHTSCTPLPSGTKDVHVVAPPCGCIGVYQRPQEPKTITVSWSEIQMRKKMVYTASCTSFIPKVNDCEPIPYKKYKTAYWESTIEYPDNKQLYDSSTLLIRPSDLVALSDSDRTDFEEYYTDGIDSHGVYNLTANTDLRCTPIRHIKLPDNTVAPFILDSLSFQDNAESIIFPMGINFDSKIVQTIIEVAYNNGLLTKKQKEKIVGWEILRGDNSIHKSVIANGIGYDIYKYRKNEEDIHFSNFPFNDLGENKFVKDPSTGKLIQHPNNGESNNKFTFLSPDMFYTKPAIPTEMSLQGYMFGSADISFADVKDHPKWTVLGGRSYKVANALAIAEVVLEAALKFTEFQVQANQGYWFIVGLADGTGSGGAVASTILTGITIGALVGNSFINFGKYRYEWLKTFRDLGRADNFASFQYGVGKHNRFLKIDVEDDNYLRRLTLRKHLRDGNFTYIDETDGSKLTLNHHLRENSVLLSTGNYDIEYPDDYKNFDNNKVSSTSSNVLASDVGCANEKRNKRDIANPYISLKNYVPDQWDGIDSIKWLTTNYIFDLQEDTTCSPIYGGTVVISRFSWRVKVPFFTDNAIKLADKLPYLYSKNSNVGDVRYFCNYETAEDATFEYLVGVFPDIKSDFNFDCETGGNKFYLRPPSKFYLFTHGIVDFLVESEINCNFRYARKEPKDQFYNNQSLSDWLQEVNLPMVEPNTFFYNNSYSFPVSNTPYKKLDRTYDKEIWKKRALKPNAWIWSEKDTNENSIIDPWLVFRPLNFWEDKTNRGKLIDLRSIESEQFIGRYEDQLQLFNQANSVADAINNQTKETGTGFLYNRPISFKKTDLGFAGTQHTDFVSTPYGHFWADAKRGRIFQVDENGGHLEAISDTIQGNPSGKKQWFREHLPFKLLRQFPQIDVDNKFKGFGMNIWFDARFDRVFFTKRDYVAINTECLKYSAEKGFYTNCGEITVSCPEGYTYNELTEKCEREFITPQLCPTGYTYNAFNQQCELTTVEPAECTDDINFDVTSTDWGTLTTQSAWEALFITQGATVATITEFSLVAGNVKFHIDTDLQILQLISKNITTVTKIDVSSILSLSLESNSITTFNPVKLPNTLEILRLTNNTISVFNPTTALPNTLEILGLGANSIVTFNPTIALPASLEQLLLNANNIVTFNPSIALPASLILLKLDGNEIVTFDPTTALPTGLEELYLSTNHIVTFNPTIPLSSGLLKLYLNGNDIVTFDPTIALPSGLTLLWLNGNEIVTFNPSIALPSTLIELDFGQNNIATFNPTIALPASLQMLDLSNNDIVNFNPTNSILSSLIDLELDINSITTASWNSNTAWISAVPNGGILKANTNFNSVVGTNTETLLLAKSWTIIP